MFSKVLFGFFGGSTIFSAFYINKYGIKVEGFEKFLEKATKYYDRNNYIVGFEKLILPFLKSVQEQPKGLSTELCNREIDNLIGIGSNYDLTGSNIDSLWNLGFGFVDVGPLTSLHEEKGSIEIKNQAANYSEAIPHAGCLNAKVSIKSLYRKLNREIPSSKLLMFNIQPNEDILSFTPYLCDDDFSIVFRELAQISDVIILNLIHPLLSEYIASPTTLQKLLLRLNDIRSFEFGLAQAFYYQDKYEHKDSRLAKYVAKPIFKKPRHPKIFIRVNPDLNDKMVNELLKFEYLEGVVIGEAKEDGNIFKESSLLKNQEINNLKIWKKCMLSSKKVLPIISSGNVFTKDDVIERIKEGADGIMMSSNLMIKGIDILEKIKKEYNALKTEHKKA